MDFQQVLFFILLILSILLINRILQL